MMIITVVEATGVITVTCQVMASPSTAITALGVGDPCPLAGVDDTLARIDEVLAHCCG